MVYRYLAVDVDGTLTDKDGIISHQVVEALEELRKKGYKVLLVSGNAYPILHALVYYLPVMRYVIAENGGIVGYGDRYVVLGREEDGAKIRRIVKEELANMLVESWQNKYRIIDLAFFPAEDVGIETAIDAARKVLDPKGFRVISSGWAIHIHPKSVNKGVGLKEACSRLGIDPNEVIAIGDSETDEPMFSVVGYSVALGNAPTTLKEKADLVTRNGFYEGFLEAINILKGKGYIT